MKFFLGSLEDDDSDDDESGSEVEDEKTLKEVFRLPNGLKMCWVLLLVLCSENLDI